ncbi:NAD(P)/FAD-dependent oxidoreductase [Umezakia ovalisporum]|jgi:glycine/D-amino acid oxidase-like deaminating enzyme|uniref:NAD(P)/FAD-dependent oxidoreductase n=1 Tax=Umezakia ovalisporum TaxID=75695 RepID=UPI0006EEA1E3|nr:D-amino acid dehydrogenase small subunit (EC 1.4. 99.1) (FAD dependent oxidoreductase) [Umezakia ovalisporum]
MIHVVIIGCGVVGAAIAYELSLIKELKITIIDRQPPAQASTGAALGVLMGVISHKIKGQPWQRRQTSIQRYETLIPELEAITGHKIPFNRQGILSLVSEQENLAQWENLAAIRHSQGWKLEVWDPAKLKNLCPQVHNPKIIGAVYSPQDRQLDPTALTLALVAAAQHHGVTCKFGVNVLGIDTPIQQIHQPSQCGLVQTTEGKIAAHWIVIAAGLGSTPLTAQLNQMLDVRPVLGQALQIHLNQPLANPHFQPVITGNDVHIVPIGGNNYWVGATVEFPHNGHEIPPNQELLTKVWHQAITFCPDLATGTIVRTWSGLRPRPENRPAPVIEKLPGFSNVILATGHYRNGVLLAPATANTIREMISYNSLQ